MLLRGAVKSQSGSHAPAWEPEYLSPASGHASPCRADEAVFSPRRLFLLFLVLILFLAFVLVFSLVFLLVFRHFLLLF